MRRFHVALAVLAAVAGGAIVTAQTSGRDIVADVRAAMASGGVASAEKILTEYRTGRGTTPEILEALSWLARGELAAKQFDKANQHAGETRDLAVAALKTASLGNDEHLQTAIGGALETLAFVLMEQGARSDAVYLLRNELDTYRGTPVEAHLRTNIQLITLEGKPAPRLESGVVLGPRLSRSQSGPSQPTLLFFWAHWCQDCKAESPTVAKLLDKYRSRGLTVVAPTRRYGYVEGGRAAAPDRELRHIVDVRDTYYRFLKHESIPVSDDNHRQYGVASVPMHVLIDRDGIVRLYHPGRMTEEALEAAILAVL